MTEADKLQQHLSLLREQYVRLQERCLHLEQDLAIVSVNSDRSSKDDSFVARLIQFVASLYNKAEYSDISVKLKTEDVKAHKFVLAARGQDWGALCLDEVDILDWRSLDAKIGASLLQWVYTDHIALVDYTQALQLIKAAAQFKLAPLVQRCEEALVGWVSVRNCVQLYTTAEEIGALTLQNHCSTLIALHWDEFAPDDFAHMSAPLLYAMFKSKTKYLLHAAVRLQREDVLFLFLIQFDSKLPGMLNELDGCHRLALDIALEVQHTSIAKSLVKHGANINASATQEGGKTLLHLAIKRGDNFACNFLLENGADLSKIDGSNGREPLHVLAQTQYSNANIEDEMTKVARKMISLGSNPNAEDRRLTTPLHTCIENNKMQLFKILLYCKDLKLNVKDCDGFSPLWFALAEGQSYGNDSFAQLLVDRGADINECDKSSNSLLHLVEISGNEAAALFLCSHGSNPSSINGDGETPLHLSCTYGMPALTTALLKVGGNPNKQTSPRSPTNEHPPTSKTTLKYNTNRLTNGMTDVNPFNPDVINFDSLSISNRRSRELEFDTNNPFDTENETIDENSYNLNSLDNMKFNDLESSCHIFRESPLHRAVRHGNEKDLLAILEYKKHCETLAESSQDSNPQLDLEDSEGVTPLGASLLVKNYSMADLLLDSGASLNILDPHGLSALHRALSRSDKETATFLIKQRADVNQRSLDGQSPLDLCIEYSLPDVCELLCKNGADLGTNTEKEPGSIPILWQALEKQRMDIAHILVTHNADIEGWSEGPDKCMQTMLHKSIDENQQTIACFLIRSGCLVNATRKYSNFSGMGEEGDLETPLHMCCEWGLFEAAQELLCCGAKINAKDSEAKMPFHKALESGNEDIAKLLLQQPTLDLTSKDKNGRTPFAIAMQRRNNKVAQSILEKYPAAAEQFDNRGLNFLHSAIQRGDLESVLFLLSIHVDLTSRTKDERSFTPLHLATLKANEMVVRNLLLAGAGINELTPQKQSCLHLCATTDQSSMAQIFMQNGIDIDGVDDNLNNVLHIAMKEGHLSMVRTLLTESRINAGCLNLRGQNALHVLACYSKDNAAAIANLFLEALPKYPIDLGDVEGNTALLLAYMRGSGQLCRVLVCAGASLGTPNFSGVHLFNYQVATRALLARLLDAVAIEPPWAEGDFCLECGNKFGLATRKHHCRHCGRLLCNKCSCKEVPILKFGINKPVRVCQMCFDVLTLGPGSVA